MAELTDGTIVWVKLSNCWWPGEVMGDERLSEDFLSSLRKKPLAVVKFFEEDAYEYVKNPNFIFKYNCPRKNEFLRKGMEQYRAKNKHMEKFPADVMHAERMTGGDPNIVNSTDFLSPKKERYSGLFQDSSKSPKGKLAKTPSSGQIPTMVGRKTIHEVRFLTQPSSSNGTARLSDVNNRMESASTPAPIVSPALTTAVIAGSQLYHCHKCGFSSSRQNVIVIHMKNCRAVGGAASSNFTPPRRPLQSTESMLEASRRSASLSSETLKPSATPVATDTDREEKQEEQSHERSLEEETTPANSRIRASRNQKVASVSVKKVTVDRRRGRRGNQAKKLLNTDSDEEKDDVPKESSIVPDPTVNQADTGNRNRQPSAVEQVNAEKGKTDAKLKNELLADWSEDEQDDDTDETEKSAEKKPPKKEAIATTPSEAQERESRSDSEPNQKNQSPSDEEGGSAKASDKEMVSVEMSPSNVSHAGSASSATTTLPLASPSGTTIKYRNIPKKQKREYIEVTNDDPSVQEKTKTVSREASGASLSMKVGSTEALIGNGVGSSASVGERPISAKQLILNRATRGSSKSLSGDETALTAVTAAAKATAKLALGDGKLPIDRDGDKADAKGHSKQDNQQKSKDKVEHGKAGTSCFDFKDDDEGESQEAARSTVPPPEASAETENKEKSVTTMQKKSVAQNERGQFVHDDASQIHVEEQQQQQDSISEEADRDAKLSKEIDFLLDETDVPKLPDDLDHAVSEKVDCNRALPPKERGKRIFKTRHSNATVTGSDVKEEELNQSESSLPMEEQLHEDESTTPINEPQAAVSDTSMKSATKLSTGDRQWENSGTNNAFGTKRKKVSCDELEGEHFQNPSITSSKQVPERETETTAKDKKAAKDTPSSVQTTEQQQQQQLVALPAKGRRGKQKKPTPITVPITPINEDNDAENNKTDAKEANLTENDLQSTSGPREDEETANAKTMRKSSENRLPDSSSIGEHPRRRSKQKHHPHEEVVTPPADALEPTRRSSKRSRKDAVPTDDSNPVDDKHGSIEAPLEMIKVGKTGDESVEGLATVDDSIPTEVEKITALVESQLKEEKTSEKQITQSVVEDIETTNKKVEKSSKDTGRLLKRKKDDTAQIVSSEQVKARDKEEPVQNETLVEASGTSEATSPVLQEKKLKTHHPYTASNSEESALVMIVDSSTPAMAMASKRTPTDLQIAEALINLPEAAAVSPKKHDPHDGIVPENQKPTFAKNDDGEAGVSSMATVSPASNCHPSSPLMVVKGAAQSSSASSSSSKSINPRKRHLHTMLLVTSADASGKEEHIPSSGETTSSPVTNVTARYVTTEQQQKPPSSSSIPEKKKRESAETIATIVKEDDGNEEKFDISSMPIVMSDSDGLLVNEAVPKEMNVNGGSGATKLKQQEPMGTSARKSSPMVASAKGGGSKVQEQIVITSKGTVLTTTSPVVAMTSKMSSATKVSSVTVTSAITLGTPGSRMSSSISATTSSSSSSSSSYIIPRRVQQEQPESSSGDNGSASTPGNANASSAMVIATPSSSSSASSAAPKKVIAKKLLSDTGSNMLSTSSSSSNSNSENTNSTVASTVVVVDRRYSGDSVTSSSSVGIVKSQQQQQQQQQQSSSNSSSSSRMSSEHPGAKKRHRVIQLTPEKLEKFNRLGYIADKGNGKVLTVEGMRKIKQQKQLSQQQKQKLHQSSSVAKTTVAAAMTTTSSSQSVRQAGEDVPEGKRKVKHTLPATHTILASRSSNSNAAGAKATVASSSHSSDDTSSTNSNTSSRPSSEVATSGNVVVAAAADSSVQELQSAGTSGGAEPSSPQVVVADADRNAVIVIESKADAENASPVPMDTPDQIAETGALQSFPPETDSMMEGDGSPTSSTTSGVVGSDMILGVQPELMASPAALVEASSSSNNTGSGSGGGVAAATAAATAATATGAEQETHEYMAVPAESFGGPPSLFYLCSMREERLVPVDNQLLYLDASNQLVALTAGHQHDSSGTIVTGGHTAEDIINQAEVIIPAGATNAALASAGIVEVAGTAVEVADDEDEGGAMSGEGGGGVVVEAGSADGGAQQSFLINTQDGQQIILDQQSLMALAASGETPHLVTADGQQILLQDTAQELLAAFAAGQQQQATLPPDSAGGSGATLSALMTAEGTQIILAQDHAGSLIELQEQASLLPADVLPVNHPSTTIETNAILTKPPIMSTVEVPSKNGRDPNGNSSATFDLINKQQSEACSSSGTAALGTGKEDGASGASIKLPTTPNPPTPSMASATTTPTPTVTNLDETLAAVIGVPSKPNVPTSLELPITVTNPAIAKTTTTSSRINPVLFPIVPAIAGQPTVEGTGTAIVLLAGGQLAATEQRDTDAVDDADATHPDHQQEAVEDGALSSTSATENVAKQAEEEEDEIQIPCTPDSQADDDNNGAEDDDEKAIDEQHQQDVPASDEDDEDGGGRRPGARRWLGSRIAGRTNGRRTGAQRRHPMMMMMMMVDDDNDDSNCSEIIPLQPNVVVLDAAALLAQPDHESDEEEDETEKEHHHGLAGLQPANQEFANDDDAACGIDCGARSSAVPNGIAATTDEGGIAEVNQDSRDGSQSTGASRRSAVER
ncbi:serine-rich adhesin for platelets-like isoform X2 [Anopheles albimanus]|uniref:serine-rich adhesin for platelets-like isoform X2 n=1 Tax=Anopheles albimanus TaxID=7167 RepID=UPI001641CD13|nr:serine-rich adhesin for platelets-like isoform X2 [Anopheles albimanus]